MEQQEEREKEEIEEEEEEEEKRKERKKKGRIEEWGKQGNGRGGIGEMVAREEEVREGIEGAIFIPFVILLPLA